MVKNFAFSSVLCLSALMSCASYAKDKNYVQLSSGYSFAKSTGADVPGKKPKRGNVYSIELGRSVSDRVKVGLEFSHRQGYSVSHDHDEYEYGIKIESQRYKWRYKSSAVMVNVKCDVANISGFTPYVLVGAGISKNSIKENNAINPYDYLTSEPKLYRAKKTNNFAYKLGAGVSYSMNSKIDLDIKYQFVNLGKFRLPSLEHEVVQDAVSGAYRKLKANEVVIGLSYKF